jgi:amidohydrolase
MRGYPALYNNLEIADAIRQTALQTIGEKSTIEMEPIMGAEDFAYMAQKAPGAMLFLGVKKDAMDRPHHSPVFDIDELALPVGAAILADTAVRLMQKYA